MRKWLLVCLLLSTHGTFGHAQTGRPTAPAATNAPPPASATVEGDVYLRMGDGEVRKMAASKVYLVPAAFRTSLAPLCEARDSSRTRYRRLRRPIRVAYDSARTSRGRARSAWLARADSASTVANAELEVARQAETGVVERLNALPSAETGMAAHYTFSGVAPGPYALYSDMDFAYFWFVRIQVVPGRQTRDLDNTNMYPVHGDKTSSISWEFCDAAFVPQRSGAPESQQRPVLLNVGEMRAELLRRYPAAIRGAGGSEVMVRLRVLEDGTVDPLTVEAISSSVMESARAETEAAAEMAAEHMRFSPAMVDGKPVRVWVTVPVNFR